MHVEQKVRRHTSGRTWEEGLNGSVTRQITMHGGAVVAGNGLVQRSGYVDEPFILEVSGFGREVFIVLPGHEAGLV